MTVVVCDTREQASGIPTFLAEQGIDVTLAQLSAGDYLVSAAFGIERKTVADFGDSLLSGRLQHQLEALCVEREYAVLLVEGALYTGKRLRAPILARFYHWMSMRRNLSLAMSVGQGQTARILAQLAAAEQSARGVAAAEAMALPVVRTAKEPLEVLRVLPGVGPKSADKLLSRFGTVAGVLNASEADLRSALGPSRGAIVHELVHRSTLNEAAR
jgi:Fanconi anemia group M protein